MKTSELTGAALDWAVAKCEGHSAELINGRVTSVKDIVGDLIHFIWEPSTHWVQGGPIIEREKISVKQERKDGKWTATKDDPTKTFKYILYGSTPLEAAMRCYVKSQCADYVDIPEELL